MQIRFPSHINDSGIVQSNQEHCYGTAKYASKKLANIGLERTGFMVGLLHDCGKFTEEFSNYISGAVKGEKIRKGSVIHTFAGVTLLLNEFHTDMGEFSDAVAEILACAVGSHHGLFDCVDPDGKSGFIHRLTKQPQYDQKAIENFFSSSRKLILITSLSLGRTTTRSS